MTYADDILLPVSKKMVLATAVFKKHFYAWTLSGTAGIWYQAASEPLQRLIENDVDAREVSSFSALVGFFTTSVAAWFWDEPAERLYYKALTGTTAFENFVIGELVFRWSQFSGEDESKNVYDGKILRDSVPSTALSVSQVFESKAGKTGSGSMGIEATSLIFSRTDFEPDGSLQIDEQITRGI
jgi:hypothetical protein